MTGALWSLSRLVTPRLAARDRIVVRFELSDRRQPNRYWLVLTRAGNEVCLHDPGFVRPSAAEAR